MRKLSNEVNIGCMLSMKLWLNHLITPLWDKTDHPETYPFFVLCTISRELQRYFQEQGVSKMPKRCLQHQRK